MYPRKRIEGSVFYISTNITNRLRIFDRPSFIIPVLDSLNYYRYQFQCKLFGYVIMLDHLHLLLYPTGESSVVSDFMRDFKRFKSGRITRQAELEGKLDWVAQFQRAGEETKRAEKKVWQDSFWEQSIFSEKFMREKLNYIHMNPVRAGLVDKSGKYPYSSFRNYEFGDNTLIDIDKDWM
jgi:REP element-mobilizing transposase RayT